MAKLTNRFSADEAIVAAVTNDSYRGGGHISVTALSKPPQIRVLEIRHADKIVEDVSDRLASLRGQIAHGIVERSGHKNEWSEKRLSVEVLGVKVTGQPDKFEALTLDSKDGTLVDFKFPTLSSFLFGFQRDKGLKPEYIQQGNCYRWLLHKWAIDVKRIIFKPTLIEWSKRHARIKKDYPDRPFFNFEIPMWSLEEAEAWITERVRLHLAAEKLPDHQLPECSEEDRWEQPAKFAVKKTGQKNAVKNGLKDTRIAAEEMAKTLGEGHYVEDRPSEAVRCLDYCRVKNFCHQYKKTIPQGVEGM